MRERIKLSSDGSVQPRKKQQHPKKRRSYRVPPDILIVLKKEFPNVRHIEKIIDKLFEKIIEKTVNDGACTITRFGHFFAYKTYSNRMKRSVPRFKFGVSRALKDDFEEDAYLMDLLREYDPMTGVVEEFAEENVNSTGKVNRLKAEAKNRAIARKSTMEKTAQDELMAMLEEPVDNW